MKKVTLLLFCTMTLNAFAQHIVLVRDSILNSYMSSGYANKKFVPRGKYDRHKQRKGWWKDYSVEKDGSFVFEGTPQMFYGNVSKFSEGIYLLYGEGEYLDGQRTGHWKFWVIEDKTFKKYLHKEADYEMGKLNGSYTYYYFMDGNIAQTGMFKENNLEGSAIVYYPTGEVYIRLNYLDGLKEGTAKNFYKDQKLRGVEEFKKDTLDGESILYYPDGTIQEKVTYVKGEEDGMYRYYHPNGQLWIEREYRNGLSWNVSGNYDASGKSRDKGTLLNGNGTMLFYDNAGKVYSILTFENGKQVKEEIK